MRAVVLLGLVATAACGLDASGLELSLPGDPMPVDAGLELDAAGAAADALDPTAREDASLGADVSAAPGAEAGQGAPVDDGGSADATTAPSGDDGAAGGQADGGALLDSDLGHGDGSSDASSAQDGSGTCSSAIPVGWSLAIYDLVGELCPAGFVPHDGFGPATVGAGACSCTCTVSQTGSCTLGTLSAFGGNGNGNACNQGWFSVAIGGPGCTQLSPNLPPIPARFEAAPLPAQGGACADGLVVDSTQLSAPAARFCEVPAASSESVCAGTVPSGFAACLVTSGDTSCPAGTPFSHRRVFEDAVALACAPCSPCGVTTSCAGATLTLHGGARCLDTGTVLTVDGTCSATGFGGGQSRTAAAVEYTAAASSTCTPGTSTAAPQPTGPRTLCCL